MPLKERNSYWLNSLRIAVTTVLMITAGCNTHDKKELSDKEKQGLDSISKIDQKHKVDSMKRINPLLILPPDSEYTGSYVDKYPSGITKFVGFYRQGKRHGQWMSFFPNGIAWSEMHYDKGLRQGPNLVYFETGKMRYSGFYKNDQQDSVWSYFDSTGKIQKKIIYKLNKLIKEMDIK